MTRTHNIFYKRLIAILPLLIIGVIASFVFFVATAVAGSITPAEVIRYVNQARSEAGLAPVKENTLLSQAAEAKARDMVRNDYFAHTSPDGKTPWYWLKVAGYQYKTAGENLAINYSSAKEQHSAWMKSPTHRANIMNSQYTEIGVAVVEGKIDGERSLVTVQFFGTPSSLAAHKSKPTPLLKEEMPSLAPAIQGEEITLPEITKKTPILAHSQPQAVSAFPVDIQSPPLSQTLELGTLITVIIISFSLVLSPLAFLIRAAYTLLTLGQKKRGESEASIPIKINIISPERKKQLQ